MPSPDRQEVPAPGKSPDFSRNELAEIVRRRMPSRTLSLCFGSGALNQGQVLDGHWHVGLGEHWGQAPTTHCQIDELPFQSRVFDLVIVQNFLTNGSESALPELRRVLKGGGRLLVLGTGFLSARYRGPGGHATPAALRPLRLCHRLRREGFRIDDCGGMGVMGLAMRSGRGWKKPLLALSDQVVINARRHESDPVVRPLRFMQPRTMGARSTALEAMNREAAA
jgi:SAM-dependent methyltransferase